MRYLLLLFTVFLLSTVNAQWSWPVQVNAFTNGPYYNYLSYYADQNDHLQILVALTDQNATSVPARLHLRIEGAGWWVETNPNNNIPPLYLEPFVPNIISGILLQPYLQESNLTKSDPSLDLNNLPEGFTEVCVEVKGVGGTLTTIGGNQCTPFWLQRFQPPQAFVPQCGAQLDTNSMFHSFQWTIPAGYTPFVNVNSEMEYTFSLYEWVDQNNYSIFQTGQGLVYQNTVTNIEQIVINDFEVQWQQGMKYVWRIQAQLYNNGMPVTIFENNGLSEICTFTYGEAQTLEEELTEGLYIDLTAFANTQYKGSANWTVIDQVQGGLSQYSSYLVEYRLKPDSEHPNPIWHYDTVVSTAKALYQLAPENTYEVRVSGMAGTFTSDPTPIVEFTTPAAVDYTCGDVQIPFRPSTVIPNKNVIAGDQVQIGQFQMTISQAIPQYEQGRYAGSGTIPVDFLGGARAKVTFDNILIDKDYIVHDGRVDVTTDGVDAWLNEQMQDFVDPIYVNGTVDSAWVDTTAGVAWVVVDGVSIEFVFDPPNYPIVIHDNSGLAWTIYPNGTISVSGYLDASNDTLDVTAENTVHFEQNPSETFGFDAKEHMEWHENYEVIELSDSTYYFVANKSIGKDETDVVDIAIPNGVTPTFKLDDQNVLSASSSGGIYTVSIPAIGSSGKTELYVYNDSDERIGKLNITVFNEKDRKVIVVPMANVLVDATQLETALQNTLGEANLDFDVTVEAQWNNATFTNSTTIALPEMTSLMTSYSQDMRDLRDAYFADPSVQKDNSAYYLFVIPDFDDPNADGYMVRGKGLGFIKAGSDYLTYAHELAHGMGALEHTWKWNGPAQGTTNNLMDYASTGSATTSAAENLTKEQWKELRDLDFAPALFDGIEDYLAQVNALSFNSDSIVNIDQVNSDPYNVSTPISSFEPNEVFRAKNGIFFRITESVRSNITHVVFNDGKVSHLVSNGDTSAFVGEGYYTFGAIGSEHVTSKINTVIFLNTSAPRATKYVFYDGDTIELCTGTVTGDYYDFEFPDCDEYEGQYVVGWSTEPVYGQINCPEEGECDSWEQNQFTVEEKNKVRDAFEDIILSAIASPGAYNPIGFIDGKNYTLKSEDKKVIEEKLRVLNAHRNDIIVGYVSMNGLVKNLMTQSACDSMAETVVNELSAQYPNKKLVLYFNHYITGIDQGVFTIKGWSCQTASFATNAPDIVASILPQDLSSFPDAVNSFLYLFKNLKKPYYITTIYEKFDGSFTWKVINKIDNPSEDVFGYPFVFGAKHVVSIKKSGYDSWQKSYKDIIEAYTIPPSAGGSYSSIDIDLYDDPIYINHASLFPQFVNAAKQEKIDNPEDWIAGEVTFEDIKESCLDAKIALIEYKKINGGQQFWTDVSLIAGANYNGYSAAIYYDFNVTDRVIDPIVYNSLDILGAIPNVDIITDALGLAYATARGDAESAIIYSAALAVPFVGAVYLHGGQKVFNYYAKVNSQGTLVYAVKSADEVNLTWTKISNEIPYKNSNKAQIKTELLAKKVNFDDNLVRNIVNADLQSYVWVDNLTTLPSGAKDKIRSWANDGLSSSKLKEAFESSTDAAGLLSIMENAKGKYHRMEIIQDFDNIPGVTYGIFPNNMSSSIEDVLISQKPWTGSTYDLPISQVENFSGSIRPVELLPGEKIYRVSNANGSSGPWWVFGKDLPQEVQDVISGTAVKPSWNDFKILYEYEVPPNSVIRAWAGDAAPQRMIQNIDDYFLAGGTDQLFIPFIEQQDANFTINVSATNTNW